MSEHSNSGPDIRDKKIGLLTILGMIVAFVAILCLAYLTS